MLLLTRYRHLHIVPTDYESGKSASLSYPSPSQRHHLDALLSLQSPIHHWWRKAQERIPAIRIPRATPVPAPVPTAVAATLSGIGLAVGLEGR